MRLTGKVAIITGAGKGIGRAIALGYGREGAAVVVNDILTHEASQTAQEIREAGGRAVAAPADVSCLEHHDKLLATAINEFCRLDILVNNAGIEFREPVSKANPDTWERTIGVNLKGPYFLSCKAATLMGETGGGAIVNVASVHDTVPLQDRAIYSISKGGVAMMTKCLALELAAHGIRVNAISPGAILTDMNRHHLEQGVRREQLLTRIALKRIGDPSDIAGAAVFLASADSDYMTGTTIYVDGGLLLT